MYGLIYMHTCTKTGKSYVGQTTKTMKARWLEHVCNVRNSKITTAIKKYGASNWEHRVLAYAETKDDLDLLEKYYIEKYDTIKNGYNSKGGGSHGLHSSESKLLMSVNRMGRGKPHTDESKKKISIANKGRKFSFSHRQNISIAKKGKKISDSMREHLSKIFTGVGNPNYGKKTSKKTIDKMRAKMGKRVLCVETGMSFLCSGEAADFLGVKRCGIQKALLNGNASHGYHWVYIN